MKTCLFASKDTCVKLLITFSKYDFGMFLRCQDKVSPLKCQFSNFRIPLMARCTRYNFM